MKKISNREYSVLSKLLLENNVTRMNLSEDFQITPAGVSKIVKKLMDMNLVLEDHSLSSRGGRPRKVLKLNKEYKKVIGVNFGPGFIDISVGYINSEIIETKRRNFYFKIQDKLLQLLVEELEIVINKYGKDNIVGLGLAINGIVNPKKGISIYSPHFKWENFKIKKYIEDIFDIPVIVDNDVRSMLRAEIMFGNLKYENNFMLLYIKDGIGSSLFLNGKIFEGSNDSAGEIGHFIVDVNSKFKCKCGKYGCFEAEYSDKIIREKINTELEKNNKQLIEHNISMKKIFELASIGKEPYYSVVKNEAHKMGQIIGNILNVVDLSTIIIAGDIINSRYTFFTYFVKGIEEYSTVEFNKKIKVIPSSLKEEIEKYGALSLIISNLFDNKKLLK